jgi:hypothetical protein
MQSTKANMKTYSILIKGTGPCGTGENNSSADLLAQTLAQTLRETGHQVTHASISTPDGTLLLHGELTVHPEPPEEKKGGGAKKKGAAAQPSKAEIASNAQAPLPASEILQQAQEPGQAEDSPEGPKDDSRTTSPEPPENTPH